MGVQTFRPRAVKATGGDKGPIPFKLQWCCSPPMRFQAIRSASIRIAQFVETRAQ